MPIKIPENINILKRFLFVADLSAAEFAKRIGYADVTIRNYLLGNTRISKRTAKAISDYTHGELTVDELLSYNPPIEKTRIIKNNLEDKGGE